VNYVVISDPRIPFGGVKRSAFGRVIKIWNA
jgi:acyl-CoA reductase-like NAD-dependent aldehyde dehydrogenase